MSGCKRILVVLFVLLFAVVAQAQQALKRVDRVDNRQGVVVIADVPYQLRLNTEIYIAEKTKRKVNRYALKAGQQVSVYKSQTNGVNYADIIVIHP